MGAPFDPIAIGSERLDPGSFLLIAGPCVLEDEGMALEVAREVRRIAAGFGIPFVFKASYAKANRSDRASYRGPGLKTGLVSLETVRERVGVPVTSDVHEVAEAAAAAPVLDLLQIPAFLCRQTPLIEAAASTGRPVHLKKGQFVGPDAMRLAAEKARAAGASGVLVTERGTMFGYHDLVVDFRSVAVMGRAACPVLFDATHSVQRPGGAETGGAREFVPLLARAAVAAGVDGLFIETHPDPARARSDRASQWPLADLEPLLRSLMKIRAAAADSERVGIA